MTPTAGAKEGTVSRGFSADVNKDFGVPAPPQDEVRRRRRGAKIVIRRQAAPARVTSPRRGWGPRKRAMRRRRARCEPTCGSSAEDVRHVRDGDSVLTASGLSSDVTASFSRASAGATIHSYALGLAVEALLRYL